MQRAFQLVLDAMVQLVDERPGSNFILLVFGEINERSEIPNDIAVAIRTSTAVHTLARSGGGSNFMEHWQYSSALGTVGRPGRFIFHGLGLGLRNGRR
jgi:hypothetical protein